MASFSYKGVVYDSNTPVKVVHDLITEFKFRPNLQAPGTESDISIDGFGYLDESVPIFVRIYEDFESTTQPLDDFIFNRLTREEEKFFESNIYKGMKYNVPIGKVLPLPEGVTIPSNAYQLGADDVLNKRTDWFWIGMAFVKADQVHGDKVNKLPYPFAYRIYKDIPTTNTSDQKFPTKEELLTRHIASKKEMLLKELQEEILNFLLGMSLEDFSKNYKEFETSLGASDLNALVDELREAGYDVMLSANPGVRYLRLQWKTDLS